MHLINNLYLLNQINKQMKKTLIIMVLVFATGAIFAQKKRTTTSATVSFDATTSLDKLPKAENKTLLNNK